MIAHEPRRGWTSRPCTAGKGETLSERWLPELPFASVLDRARALDHGALSLLYSRYLPVVRLYVQGRVRDAHVAEDVTSETFLAMVDSIERVRADEEPAFAAWLLNIARNKVADHYRRQAVLPTTQGMVAPWEEPAAQAEAGDPLGVVTARESWAEVASALRQLTEEQRLVVLYRCVLGYDTEEVARLLDRQPGAVRALQFRALASLARLLAASGTSPAVAALHAGLGSPTRGRWRHGSDDDTRR
jgi:RNA polymerase sigma-70 factor, ECF subfamily